MGRYFCNICHRTITEDEYDYSMDVFDRALCRYHQKQVDRGYNPRQKFKSTKKKPPPSSSGNGPTWQASRLATALRKRDWEVILEYYDGHKHVDLYIPDAEVYIEVDGPAHAHNKKQAFADLMRTYYSFRNDGILTLRIPNCLASDNGTLDETANLIDKFLHQSEEDEIYEDDS